METVTISLQRYEELINDSKEKISGYIKISDDYSSMEFKAYKGFNQEQLGKLAIDKIIRDNILKNVRNEDYYKKEKKYISDTEKCIKEKLKQLEKKEESLNERDLAIDKKWMGNLLFKVGFFLLLFIVFIETKIILGT